jgi:holo-[acyl-carrier protein] synthase
MRMGLDLIGLGEAPAAEAGVFTPSERRYCLARHDPAPSLAARFAAKRAARRALGLSADEGLEEIEIVRRRGRAPTLSCRGEAQRAAQSLGLRAFHVSLSHSGHYAVALVVME